jgi:hypothetical protein
MQAGMARSRWFTVLSLVLGVGAGLAGAGCKDEKPDGSTVRLQQEYRDQEKKKTEDAAREKAKKELDELIPRLMEKRKPLDAAFQGMWQSLPDVKGMKRKECPDKQILADTPDPEKRKVLVFNKESLYLLTGQADGRPDAGAEAIHTVAAYPAFGLRRPEGKETPLLDRSVPDSAESVNQQLAAADYVAAHRYIGIGLFTAFYEPDATAARPKPTRVEGWTVVFDQQTKKPLCQVEAAGEGLVTDGVVMTGQAADEEAWAMFILLSGKNMDAISKALTVEGARTTPGSTKRKK